MANNELLESIEQLLLDNARILPRKASNLAIAIMTFIDVARPATAPAQGGLSDALPERWSKSYAECTQPANMTDQEWRTRCMLDEIGRLRQCILGQQGGGDAADRVRLNWIEDQSDFGPIEITLGKGSRPNTTATYLTYGADDGSRISSGPARHVRAAIDQCKNPDAAIQAQAGDATQGGDRG